MLIVEKMLIFLVLMLVGLLLAKLRILDELTSKKLSSLVLYVASPALIIESSQTEHTIPNAQLLTAGLIAVIAYAMLIAVAAIVPKVMRLRRDEVSAYNVMTVFSNIGFIGIPLVSEILGESALLYVTVFILLYNLLIYTYGIFILQHGSNAVAGKRFSLQKLINPGVIACVIAVVLYFLHIKLPDVLAAPLGYLSNLTAPLSMLVIGAALVHVNIRSFVTDYKLLSFAVLKLLVVPILFCLLLKVFIGAGDLLGVCIVMMGTPVGSMTVMMAQQYGGESELLSRGVTLTTVLCIATIPIVFAAVL